MSPPGPARAEASPAVEVEAQDAATVALLRDRQRPRRVEVLLLRRPGAATFAAGAEVFPGGGVEPADRDPEWQELVRAPEARPDLVAFKVAAIRECFEETGVLLARMIEPRPPSTRGTAAPPGLRRRLLRDGPGSFRSGLLRAGLRPAFEDLVFCAHWVTPLGVPRRFDARFFLAKLPPGGGVRPHRGEVPAWRWAEPGAALVEASSGERQILPPTRSVLAEIVLGGSTGAALEQACRSRVRRVLPRLHEINSTRYPGLDLAGIARAHGA
ncbi:MAG: NUDIX hydrolase [Candidatus Dormibacteria bacterium]